MIIIMVGVTVVAAVDHMNHTISCLHIGDIHFIYLVALWIVHAHGSTGSTAHFPVSPALEVYRHFFRTALHEVGILIALARLATSIPCGTWLGGSLNKTQSQRVAITMCWQEYALRCKIGT